MEDKHPTYANGKVCYIEIPSDDVNVSAAFYETVFGWNIRRRDDGSISFDDGAGEVSGTWITDRKAVSEIGMITHIMVDDINITMKIIKDNGGKITEEIGRHLPEITARFADPYGNIWGLYQERN
ncbi:VOC family protein [Dyadobacter subterraneus]|uniref:VOC family protein n=1 Tax=Dyadobacter subterraneus TaxID=2773304 RepID=A0ABR9WB32_9BACT|nr:VOC family protein [Dyadobacter subterraneus]MBE9462354.1 VOC family protein [Dyadobacter subterraneus]